MVSRTHVGKCIITKVRIIKNCRCKIRVALLNLSSWCLVMVTWLFLAVPWGCLQFVIVVFPDHTHFYFSQKFSHRLEKYLNLGGLLEKSLKIKSVLKSTGKALKGLENRAAGYLWI